MSGHSTARHAKRGRHKIRVCDYIVDLGGGRTYVCGRHTKNKSGICSQHQDAAKAQLAARRA